MDMYQYEKVMTFVDEEDVKFIRLPFLTPLACRKIFLSCPVSWSGPLRRGSLLTPPLWQALAVK